MSVRVHLLAGAACALIAGAALAQPAPAPTPDAAAPPPAAAPAAPPAPPAPGAVGYRPIAPAGDIFATLQASGEFNTFIKAVSATNLAQILKTQPNITVLAPTDAAFAAMPPAELASLMANVPQLQALVTYHLINARLDGAKIKGHAATPVATVANSKVTLDGSGPALKANDADIIQPDVVATNGVVHVIDKVLSPSWTPPAASASAEPIRPATQGG